MAKPETRSNRKGCFFVGTLLIACSFARTAAACPFCTTVAPSLAQERETADVVALAEVTDATTKPPRFRLHRVTKGAELLVDRESIAAGTGTDFKQGELVLLFGSRHDGALHWSTTVVNETSAAYFFRAPSMRAPEIDRLKYFSEFLEHPDSTIAEDAYREFGHARFDVVAKVVNRLPNDRVREWLTSDRVPQTRKGLYGLVLGLVSGESERRANADFLKKLILSDESDFRAGFDGVLGGYLLLTGNDGLKLIETRFLANPKAAVGDVRHAMTALRFYHEYGREISAERLRAALAKVLARPEFAEAAITDLSRWQAWEFCDQIAGLYEQPAFSATEIRRAIVGYLHACPEPAAAKRLARLREVDPAGVAAAEEVLSKLGKLPQ
jgi:hypothetical protein